jgi:hypothetical protein
MSDAAQNTPPASAPPATPPAGAVVPPTPPAATPPAGAPPSVVTPPADGGNIIATPPAGTPPGDTPPAGGWPDDWRARVAGDDKEYLKRLERFQDPAALAKSYRELERRLSSGELRPGLKPDATPEEVSAWRKANGIPESVNDYKVSLPDGVVLGEAEKPLVDSFKEAALTSNMTPDQVNKAMAWFFDMSQKRDAEQYQADQQAYVQTMEALRRDWGHEYTPRVNALRAFLTKTYGAELGNQIGMARLPDGRILGNVPEYLNATSQLRHELDPYATVMPSGTLDPAKAGEDRIKEIEGIMRTDPQKYWKTPDLQNELAALYDARVKSRPNAA